MPRKPTRPHSAATTAPSLVAGTRLSPESLDDWRRLQQVLPLTSGPRLLFALGETKSLSARLARQLAAEQKSAGRRAHVLEFTSPRPAPLQVLFDELESAKDHKVCFWLGLELSLLSETSRTSAINDLNLHRDQLATRLPCPLVIWTTDEAFTLLAKEAPDFVAWRSGVFTFHSATERAPSLGTTTRRATKPGMIAVLVTDIVSSTKLKHAMPGNTSIERDRQYSATIRKTHDALVQQVLGAFGGRLVNTTGDGFLLSFPDPETAVQAGLQFQDILATKPLDTPLGPLQVRMGVHTGSADQTGGDFAGAVLDKAARVAAQAEGGQILVSNETQALIHGKLRGVVLERLRPIELKGVGVETLFRVLTGDIDPDAAAEAAYRQHLIDRFGKLTLYSVTSDAPLAVDLERVFVKLTATIPKQTNTWPDFPHLEFSEVEREAFRHALPDQQDLLLASKVLDKVGVENEQGFVRHFETTVTLSLSEALAAHTRCAVIGAPGSGKTTLLKYLALTFARKQAQERLELTDEKLPIFVALRDFNRYLDNLDTRGLLLNLTAAMLADFAREHTREVAPYLNLPSDFFARALESGRAVVLLDGLDEVADPGKRARAAEAVAAFVREYKDCRFVVTSRPRGYEAEAKQRLASLLDECTVQEFTAADRKAFATSWYTAVITDRLGDSPTARADAVAWATDLLAAIDKDPRIQSLASNPLLLSILALVHQRGTKLPERRVDLYWECVDFLLGYWDQIKGGEAARELVMYGGLTRQERARLLEPVALWLHERGESGLEVDANDLQAQVALQFTEEFNDAPAVAARRAALFLKVIVERAGLLTERETGVFAFTHLTFQEYLAARAIADRDDYVEYVLAHLHESWWREVALLTVGHLSALPTRRARKLATALISRIRSAGSELEDVLKRDLLLAARALADTGPLAVEPDVRAEIIAEVVRLWRESPYEPQREEAASVVALFMSAPEGEAIAAELLKELQDKNDHVRRSAAHALGALGAAAATPETLTALVKLTVDKNDGVRGRAAQALGALGAAAATPETLTALVKLTADTDEDVHWSAAQALGALGAAAATPETLTALMKLIVDKNDGVRGSAAWALGALGAAAATPETVTALKKVWNSELNNTDYVWVGVKSGRTCDLAYAELQRLVQIPVSDER